MSDEKKSHQDLENQELDNQDQPCENCANLQNEFGKLQEEKAELEELIKQQEEQIASLNKIIGEANTMVAEPQLAAKISVYNGKECEWLKDQFRIAGDATIHTPESANEELVQRILEMDGQNILRVIEE